jgi:hypothetical protein
VVRVAAAASEGANPAVVDAKPGSTGPQLTPDGLAALTVAQLHTWPNGAGSAGAAAAALQPSAKVKTEEGLADGAQARSSAESHLTGGLKSASEKAAQPAAVRSTAQAQKDQATSASSAGQASATPVARPLVGIGKASAYLNKVPRIPKVSDGTYKPITIPEAAPSPKASSARDAPDKSSGINVKTEKAGESASGKDRLPEKVRDGTVNAGSGKDDKRPQTVSTCSAAPRRPMGVYIIQQHSIRAFSMNRITRIVCRCTHVARGAA